MYLLNLAARNLERNWLRTLIAVLAIAVVVMIVIFGRGLMLGFTESTFRLYIDNELGHVRVTDEEYRRREALLSLDYTVGRDEELQAMIAELKGLGGVEHVLPRLKFGAMASVDDELIRMAGIGVDADAESAYGALEEDIEIGRLPRAENEIVVGSGLLKRLQAEPGTRVTLVFSDAYQSLQGRTFEIVGVRDTGSSQLDDYFFHLPLATAQRMLGLEGEVTELLVFGRDADAASRLEDQITPLLAEWPEGERYAAVAWHRADPMIELMRQSTFAMNFVYLFFILLGTVVVVSTLTMIIRERRTEIGMMAALGLRSGEIMKLFTWEGALIGIIGSLLGVIGGGLINYHLAREGLHVEAFAQATQGMDALVEPVFYTVFSLENLLVSFLLGAVVTTLACLLPARNAARLNPVEALEIDA